MSDAIYNIPLKTIDGEDTNLESYKGDVLLLVNVASKCGLTPQYEGLQKLYSEYESKGFKVLGFPSNDFMGQEPGTEDEIKSFCSENYDVTFPMFSKIGINGENRHELYQHLIENHPETEVNNGGQMLENLIKFGHKHLNETDVLWNFEKFLVGKDGEIVGRFAPDVKPDDERLTSKIDEELAK